MPPYHWEIVLGNRGSQMLKLSLWKGTQFTFQKDMGVGERKYCSLGFCLYRRTPQKLNFS